MTHKELYELAGRIGDYKLRRKIENLIFNHKAQWNEIINP